MRKSTRLVRDSADRLKLKVSLTRGRYQLSLDEQAVILFTDELDYSERDIVPDAIVPILVATGDAWFPRERDTKKIIQDLPASGTLGADEQTAVKSYLTSSTWVQERNVDQLLSALEDSPVTGISREDLQIKSLPVVPGFTDHSSGSAQTIDTGESEVDGEREEPEADNGPSAAENSQSTQQDEEGGQTSTANNAADPVLSAEDYTRIPGIGPTRAERLAKLEINSFEEVAELRPSDLATIRGITEGVAAVTIEGARVIVGDSEPMDRQLAAQAGESPELFDKALSSIAASGVPPSEAAPTLRAIYGPTIGAVDAVTGVQAYYLWEAGYQTPKDLIDASTEELESVEQIGSATAPQIQSDARTLIREEGWPPSL